ncbi:dual specificity protein phosphatase 10-like [Anneissia japonica]|uniref:dual specificity protein phosphatase 10-like n=1 Tax=Anneissia japonica TaxID=1529436 RepID=UPI0014254FE1|nr:dual specificity protein phosphatase 10-like [Anneissia japonica]
MPPFGTEISDGKSVMESISLRSSKCCAATAASSPKPNRLIARSATPSTKPKSTPNSPKHIINNYTRPVSSSTPHLTYNLTNSPVFRHRRPECKPTVKGAHSRPRPTSCVRHINACELYQKFHGRIAKPNENIIIIDSRPFTEFTKRHIQGAFNVLMNPMRRRRLLDGKMTVADMISCERGRLQLKNRAVHEVVLYDEDSDTLDNVPANSAVKCLVTSLEKEGAISVFLLKGGMKEFETQYRDMCNIGNEVKSSKCESEETVNTPLLEQVESCFLRATKEGPGQPSQIVPCIYIGGDKEAADLDALNKNNIGHVLNVTTKLPNYHEKTSNISYKRIPVRDDNCADISQYFDQAFDFIDLALKKNSGILIHCQAGISRSPTVTIAYIMKKNYPHMTMSQAYTLVKNRRSVISPNLHFVGQLASYEQKLKSSSRSVEQKRCPLVASRSSTPVESAV